MVRYLSRRLLLTSAVASALLAACGPAADSTPPVAPAQPAAARPAESKPAATKPAEKPRGGDQIVFSVTGTPLTLNPAFSAVSDTIYFSQFFFDGLTRPDDSLQPAPSLAESWTVSPDGLNYTFNLRGGVKFHDGKELTSADVKFTWELISHPANKTGAQLYGFFSRIKGAADYRAEKAPEIVGIQTPDPRTVKVELTSVYAPFLSISAFQSILPKHIYGAVPVEQLDKHELARKPVGTGPFKLVELKDNQHVLLDANTGYWGGRPKVDRLVLKVVADATVLPSLLRSGEVDVIGLYRGLPVLDYAAFAKDPAFKIVDLAAQTNWYVEFNLTNPLFQDARVRQAIIRATDRRGIVEHLLLGHGRVVDTVIHPISWGYSERPVKYEYDLEAAKRLFAEAGWKPGSDGVLTKDGKRFGFELITFMPEYPEILQEQWKKLGLDVQLKRADFSAVWAPVYLAKKHDVIALHQPMGIYADPDYPLTGYYSSRLNRNTYNNPRVDEIIVKATGTTDQAERKKAYAELNEILATDAPHMWIAMPDEIWTHNTKVRLPDKKLGFLMLTNVKDWERIG
ncbi:MAG: hypothetical protein EPO26_14795 [Chloroflexota bacterium]|nr:MAG: hypothetical protein EPO26_14795 [Chloroflexota bacterium]